jgi:hypothetical protein
LKLFRVIDILNLVGVFGCLILVLLIFDLTIPCLPFLIYDKYRSVVLAVLEQLAVSDNRVFSLLVGPHLSKEQIVLVAIHLAELSLGFLLKELDVL